MYPPNLKSQLMSVAERPPSINYPPESENDNSAKDRKQIIMDITQTADPVELALLNEEVINTKDPLIIYAFAKQITNPNEDERLSLGIFTRNIAQPEIEKPKITKEIESFIKMRFSALKDLISNPFGTLELTLHNLPTLFRQIGYKKSSQTFSPEVLKKIQLAMFQFKLLHAFSEDLQPKVQITEKANTESNRMTFEANLQFTKEQIKELERLLQEAIQD